MASFIWPPQGSGSGGVSSLNALTGALTLVAGTGITITPVGSNITIATTGGTGTVTSVDMTVPAFLSVSGNPITTAGTLAVTLSGTALPIANGGTGSTSQNFVDLTTAQSIAGSKSFSAGTNVATAMTSTLTVGNAASTATHVINGGLRVTTRTITSSFTIDTTTTDFEIFCNNSAAINITLPTPTNGRLITIKDFIGTAQTNPITIVRHASELIEGLAASYVFQTNWGSITLTSNGTNWLFV